MSRLLAGEVERLILIGRPQRLSALEDLRNSILGAQCEGLEVQVSDDLRALRQAQVVVCASNSARPLVFAEMIHPGRVLICDISVPGDLAPDLTTLRPEARIIRGGVVYSPDNPGFYIPGIPLPEGHLFACMTETILMGFERMSTHFSLGEIRLDQVKAMEGIAIRHGFHEVVSKMAQSY